MKSYASQLSVVFSQLCTWSLKDNTVPFTWKTSVICPVPKKTKSFLFKRLTSDCSTSIVMKCFERIILHQLMKHTKPHLDPYQFAYKHNRSTEDATRTLLHNAYTHLEKPSSFARILFIDSSSAFNTIQPHLMASKLLKLDPRLILSIVDFLVSRSQTVCHQAVLSSSHSIAIEFLFYF